MGDFVSGTSNVRCKGAPQFTVNFELTYDSEEGTLTGAFLLFRRVNNADPATFIQIVKKWKKNTLIEWDFFGLVMNPPPVLLGAACAVIPPGSPEPEVCDGLDNDCDGIVDNDVVGVGEPCDGVDSDFCSEGTLACSGEGGLFCDDPGDNLEICGNGLDDDCDGIIDEDCL